MSLVKIIKRYQIQIDVVLDKMPTTDKIHDVKLYHLAIYGDDSFSNCLTHHPSTNKWLFNQKYFRIFKIQQTFAYGIWGNYNVI